MFHQTNDEPPHTDIYRFSPTWRPWAPARNWFVYLTGGMSEREMPSNPTERHRAARIELCALSREVHLDEGRDLVAWSVSTLAHTPWRTNVSFAPLETITWGVPLVEGSVMSAFFFIAPPLVDLEALQHATVTACLVLQVMTIGASELALAKRDGSMALVDRLERNGVEPLIDFNRRDCVRERSNPLQSNER
ncbi:MAG: suppressor of fused domain protein [Vicinamibacterales bacterium]